MKNIILKLSALFLGVFGLVSLFMTGSIIFDLFEIRAKADNFIPFIIYTNFVCSFIYLFASYGLITKNKLTTICLFIAVAILIIAYVGLILYINSGGAYQTRTVIVMLFRIAVTIIFAGIAWYYISRTKLGSVQY